MNWRVWCILSGTFLSVSLPKILKVMIWWTLKTYYWGIVNPLLELWGWWAFYCITALQCKQSGLKFWNMTKSGECNFHSKFRATTALHYKHATDSLGQTAVFPRVEFLPSRDRQTDARPLHTRYLLVAASGNNTRSNIHLKIYNNY